MVYQIMKPQRIPYSPMLPRTLLGGEGLLAETLEYSSDALRECCFWSDQANDQKSIGREVIEVTGVNIYILGSQKFEGKFFVGSNRRNTKHRVPTAFHGEPAARVLPGQLTIQLRKIFADA